MQMLLKQNSTFYTITLYENWLPTHGVFRNQSKELEVLLFAIYIWSLLKTLHNFREYFFCNSLNNQEQPDLLKLKFCS